MKTYLCIPYSFSDNRNFLQAWISPSISGMLKYYTTQCRARFTQMHESWRWFTDYHLIMCSVLAESWFSAHWGTGKFCTGSNQVQGLTNSSLFCSEHKYRRIQYKHLILCVDTRLVSYSDVDARKASCMLDIHLIPASHDSSHELCERFPFTSLPEND